MTPRPDGRPTLEELQAARRREVAARRREITKASRDAKGLSAPAPPRPLRIRPSDEHPVGPPRPRKGDAGLLRHQEAERAVLTPSERALLDEIQAALRRRADLRLRPQPGVEPPPLPGTPEERAAVRAKLASVPVDAPAAKRGANRAAHEDFDDLGPGGPGAVQSSSAYRAGAAAEAEIEAELEELI